MSANLTGLVPEGSFESIRYLDIILYKYLDIYYLSRLFQYIGGFKNSCIAPALSYMLLDGAATFRETTECRRGIVEKFLFVFIYFLLMN